MTSDKLISECKSLQLCILPSWPELPGDITNYADTHRHKLRQNMADTQAAGVFFVAIYVAGKFNKP